jgi:hypothetical protein
MNTLTNVVNNSLPNDVSVFPNPTSSILNFNVIAESAKLLNLQGNVLLYDNNTNNFDLSLINPGVYFLELQIGLTKKQFKVIRY